jgi:hypothetical protein
LETEEEVVPRRKQTEQPEPMTHVYRHELSKDRYRDKKYQQLLETPLAVRLIVAHAKLKTYPRYGFTWLDLPCFVNPEHTVGEDEPGPLLLLDSKIECEVGGHDIDAGALIDYLTMGEAKAVDELLAKFNFEPELVRGYLFETDDNLRSVGADQAETMQHLGAKPSQPVRGVVIECESLQLAKQLAGQEGTRKKFHWHPDVPRTRTGQLASCGWHGAYLTERERVLDRTLRAAAEATEREARMRELANMRRELGL